MWGRRGAGPLQCSCSGGTPADSLAPPPPTPLPPENQSEGKRLSAEFFAAGGDATVASTTDAPPDASLGAGTPVHERAQVLAVSKKHSGSLLMAPPFYSKNGVGNRFSRMGAVILKEYVVWVL